MKFKNSISYFLTIIIIITLFSISVKAFSTDTNSKSQKIIYLTFDDGPSKEVSEKILDILKSENIKATFFIIGYKVNGNEYILKRIKNEGHSIGLHTFTHDYNKIYKDPISLIDEMNQSADAIKSVLGYSSKIIRFPSGSKGHMNVALLEKLHSLGYKVFDWNICLSDGINHNTPVNILYNEGTKKCINPNRIFLLAHCSGNNQNTCRALPKIIKYYKALGYKFMPITERTKEYHFKPSI